MRYLLAILAFLLFCTRMTTAQTAANCMAENILPPVSSEEDTVPLIALRTNLLYDLALVPNIGVEWFLHDRWSVALNVMYVWLRLCPANFPTVAPAFHPRHEHRFGLPRRHS